MYKKITLDKYNQDKLKAYTQGACSRFELSVSFKIKGLKNLDFLYALSKAVNDTKELKRSVINNEVIEYKKLNPAYVLEKNENIVSTYTDFCDDYDCFAKNYQKDYEEFKNSDLVFCLKNTPENVFYVSSFKGHFESFSLHLKHGFEFYQPIFTSYKNQDKLTLYANFHHAFFDLAKAKSFFEKFEKNWLELAKN